LIAGGSFRDNLLNIPDQIPYDDFGGEGPLLHFAHANGYPPGAYRELLSRLSAACQVVAIHLRPLWPNSNPRSITDWRPLAGDLERFLDQKNWNSLFGTGHSMGATTTLRLALQRPDRFKALILIDPVIFSPIMSVFWRLVSALHLEYRLHPLVKGALKRRVVFESKESMFETYRKKSVFRNIRDPQLAAYVDASAKSLSDGTLTLRYPPSWEARIYATGVRADLDIWRALPSLRPPLFIIRGALSNTFREKTARMLNNRLPSAEILSIPDATHLVPLEYPERVTELILEFLDQKGFRLEKHPSTVIEQIYLETAK
jgi:pimeloyl-ACP methyl ester carboxylesterase